MSTFQLPPLPETSWCGLVNEGGTYEPEWTSYQTGYTDEDMHAYALAAVASLQVELAAKQAQIPPVLFDGYSVLQALTTKAKPCTSAENVSAVLDAVVRLMRAAQPAPVMENGMTEAPAGQVQPIGYMNAGHVHEMQQQRLPYGYLYPQAGVGVDIPVFLQPAVQQVQTHAATPVAQSAPMAQRITKIDVMSALNLCPTDLSFPDRCQWIANRLQEPKP